MAKAKKVVKPSEVAAKKESNENAKALTGEGRAIRYPVPLVRIHVKDWEDMNAKENTNIYAPPLTASEAKKLLGWETENEYLHARKRENPSLTDEELEKFRWKPNSYFLVDKQGNKVRLHNNINNRPWTSAVSAKYCQDILNKHFEFNGENVIIGRTGMILSAQHRLIALVLAEQERTGNDKHHWEDKWKGPCYIETCAAYGIDESPKIRRTIDNVKPRSLSDVLFADTSILNQFKQSERKELARMVDYGVRTLWKRLKLFKNAWAPTRTHSESLAFLDNHKKFLECVAFMHKENKDNRISKKYLYAGNAAALMYLMSTGKTTDEQVDDYCATENKNEGLLNFDLMKKAKQFWTDLANADESMKTVRLCRRPQAGDNPDEGLTGFMFPDGDGENKGGTVNERMAVIIKAWEVYKDLDNVEDLVNHRFELSYEMEVDEETNGLANWTLNEYPTIAGVDLGEEPKKLKKDDSAANADTEDGTNNSDEYEPADELSDEEGDKRVEKKAKKGKAKKLSRQEEWESDKEKYEGMLFYKSESGNFVAVCDDATESAKLLSLKTTKNTEEGYAQLVLSADDFEEKARHLIDEEGQNVYVVHNDTGERLVVDAEIYLDSLTDEEEVDTQEDDNDPVDLTEGEEESEKGDDAEKESEESEPEPKVEERVEPQRLKDVPRRKVARKK